MLRRTCIQMVAALALTTALHAQDAPGQVQLPLEVYQQLLANANQTPGAPLNHALGNAQATVSVTAVDGRPSAEVSMRLTIEIYENQWALVPVLPPGTSVTRAVVSGNSAQLVATPQGLAWSTNVQGTYTMQLTYRVDAVSSEDGFVLAVPTPEAASLSLTATLPGTGLDVAVIPAAGVRTTVSGGNTSVQATVPTTRAVQLSWRAPSGRGASFSRARYRGELTGDAVVWRGEFRVELFSDEAQTVKLLPRSVTLTNLQVDGREAPIIVEGKHFATFVEGRGAHTVVASFQTQVLGGSGPPSIDLAIPKVPVSQFELTLPGRKELAAEPGVNPTSRVRGNATVATVNVPLTNRVKLSWSESVPDVVRRELRANATLFHILHAEEGVLFARARVQFDVRRGETNRLSILVPGDVQVNEVSSESGAVADWRVRREGNEQIVEAFLDRQLQGELVLDVLYDRSLAEGDDPEALPLVSARGVGRQRGMVALLSSRDLTLEPQDEGDATRVGENQLPAFVRDDIEMTIAHTFKYADLPPTVTVTSTVPERVAGRFDAQVDSLLSLGDVTLTGTAGIEVHVKSGAVDALEVVLPENANLLNLTAPSLRSHRPSDDDPQVIELQFTQDMEGRFRIDLSYEHILSGDESDVPARTVHVRGADVEQGRIAVEASSAVEVQPSTSSELLPVEVSELPRQLVLQTTNPILLAYKYVRAEPEPTLALRVTRHRVVDTQEATIDSGHYQTLFTRDGLSVTSAHFFVRNQRKQFLRIELPEDSEVWSVFVDGQPERPALDSDEDAGGALLIKIKNRTEGFPVNVVYATRSRTIGRIGSVRSSLPRPDILVTESSWDIFLPEGYDYGPVATNMELVQRGQHLNEEQMQDALRTLAVETSPEVAGPLHIRVPTSGVQFGFRKLYANQADVEAFVSVSYSTASGTALGQLISLLATGLIWLGAWMLFTKSEKAPRRAQQALVAVGGAILVTASSVYHVSLTPAVLLSLAAAGYLLAPHARQHLERARSSSTPATPAAPPEEPNEGSA